MVSITEQSGKETTYLTEFVCDTKDDMKDLPGIDKIAQGSRCIVVEPFEAYMLNSQDEWIKIC